MGSWYIGEDLLIICIMDDFKGKISKEVLDTLTMEDLWNSPRLKKYVEEEYPRAYLAITEPMREFGLFHFIELAENQKKVMQQTLEIGSIEKFPKRDIKYALKVIKQNKIKSDKQLWYKGIPFKFELSRFVKHYAVEKTYAEWREILNEISSTKSNIERILTQFKNKFKKT